MTTHADADLAHRIAEACPFAGLDWHMTLADVATDLADRAAFGALTPSQQDAEMTRRMGR